MRMAETLIPFCKGWTFLRTELDVSVAEAEARAAEFAPVELPHDWLIYDTENLYRDGCGWYRRSLQLEEVPAEGRIQLRFEGVYMDSALYVNGQRVGDWKYGYSTFDMDITDFLCKGRNELLVQVRFQAPNSRWYSGAGIYRRVWLKVCDRVYLPFDGTYVSIKPCEKEPGEAVGDSFLLEAETEVAGAFSENTACHFTLWKDGRQVQDLGRQRCGQEAENCRREMPNLANGKPVTGSLTKLFLRAVVDSPKLWDVETPNCYELRVELYDGEGEEALDRQQITVGFRTIVFDPEQGCFLNGRYIKIHGVCEHHDLGCLGAAFHSPAMERKLRLLKNMGVNAIRTSHNMQSPEFMELADRMGFLVDDEAFDMWERTKTTYDYGRFFKEWAERDVRSWVRRDRNHPCLMLWSIGNEIYDTHADGHGQEITGRLMGYVREHDPKENAPITIGSNYMPWENAQKCADIVKFAGYNYGEKYYEAHHREHPDWIMYGSETASIVQSRGIYHFPLRQSVLADEDEQCSALGNSTTSWGARSLERCITDDRDAKYIFGQFLWSGFDYIGEPTPYHTKNSYFGQIDTAGFPKDAYYVFQAEWTDCKKAPMVHLFPYWDFNPGQLIDVRACTNAPVVELFVNGVSYGRQEIDHEKGKKLLGDWQVPYAPGTVTAVAYDSEGREIARDSRTSYGDSHAIRVTADKLTLSADGQDMCFLTIETVDDKGNPVENARDYVCVELEGPGRLLGMDNGDSTDYEPYKTNVRRLFSGKLLAVIGSTREAGAIKVTVTGRELIPASLMFTADKEEENAEERSNGEDRPVEEDFSEDCGNGAELPGTVPVRKVELCALDGQRMDGEKRELTLEAVVYPAAADPELIWRVVNEGGIDIGFARIEEVDSEGNRHRAVVTAYGDGSFLVRCMAKTENKITVISQLEYTAEGLGQAFLNPYEFISAGLYTDTLGEIGNGNEKGIATARDGMSGVVYSDIDFGAYGSDRITLPVFALSDDPYPIEIWLGKPFETGGRLIDTVIYQKPSRWNVYQEETYQLPERLRGIVTLGFVMRAKVHLKGFWFEKQEKAFGCLFGEDADSIYGDSFRRDGSAIREIGNNVTLVYDAMDFGEMGTGSITICGATPLEGNSIHIHFTEENGETVNRIVEFAGTNGESREQTFELEPLKGMGKIEFIFLPGSRFDLEYFRFHEQ